MRVNPLLGIALIAFGYVAAITMQHQQPPLPVYEERPTPVVLRPPSDFKPLSYTTAIADLQGPVLHVNADGRLLAVCPRCQQEWALTKGDERYGPLPDPHIYALCQLHHIIYWRGGECPLCESATAHPEKQ